ncbi:MAG TPA: hypothetical protein ENK57_00370, partial [Polyangiaceae bacterium]|nr:hypothetical protein [Polyangiaceae bacterium]
MDDDSFTHDEASFERGESRGGVAIADGEARYADLVAEVIWAGTITPESRVRLETARDVFGLSSERAAQIEEAQIATTRVQVFEEPTIDDTSTTDRQQDDEPAPAPESQVSPIAASTDPRIRALQRRIIVVEDENDELAFENRSLKDLVQQLENLVEQLQYALEETLDELHQVKGAHESQDHAKAPTASMVHAVVPPPDPPESAFGTPVDHAPPEENESGPESGPTESVEIPLGVGSHPPVPEVRPELPTLMGLGDMDVEAPPDTQPRPHVPGAVARTAEQHGIHVEESSPEMIPVSEEEPISEPSRPSLATAAGPRSRRRFRSHQEIEEAIEPIFEAAPPGVTRRKRRNPADLHDALRVTPRDPDLLRALFSSLGRADDADRRWCVAHALVYLEVANDEERSLYDAHVTSGLVRPRRALDDGEWHDLLFHPEEELLTGQILAAIAPAVLLGRMTAIRNSISPELLAPEQQIDPSTSTLQAVRCLVWAAAILGLPTPPIFVVPEHDGGIDVVLNPRPTTRLGKRALSGRRSRELAFDAGRHLSWYRKEHLLGRPSRSIRRLEDSFLAALMIGNPGLP